MYKSFTIEMLISAAFIRDIHILIKRTNKFHRTSSVCFNKLNRKKLVYTNITVEGFMKLHSRKARVGIIMVYYGSVILLNLFYLINIVQVLHPPPPPLPHDPPRVSGIILSRGIIRIRIKVFSLIYLNALCHLGHFQKLRKQQKLHI